MAKVLQTTARVANKAGVKARNDDFVVQLLPFDRYQVMFII